MENERPRRLPNMRPAHTKPLARDDPIFSMTWRAAPCGATGPDEERDTKCPSRRVP
jgi:hypothetical protein